MMDEDCRGNEALNDRSEVQDPLGALGFQTAGMKLKSELAQKGRSMKGVGRGAGALGSTQGMGGYAPRTGLSRPKGGQGNVVSGLRGGFVPPFVRKAVNALGGQDTSKGDNPMSAKMLQLLAGPDGELPESLQKFDPALIDMVCNEVLDEGAAVDWEDIAGQDAAKQLIQEIVVWPMMNPTLFMGARAPPKGILLFGPPGTGKTLLGKAIASNIKATFFNISASSLTSKWIGEGEKMVRTLFAVAEFMQPSVIFIDEIDSILSARKSEGEHEASRRLKTELLVQMEGCNPNSLSRRILLVGATNRPEELDEAARRRMPKQLYIPLPCEPARKEMILRQLGAVKSVLSQEDVQKVVQKTDGYSGADMRNLIQEALQGPVREAVRQHGSKIATLSESDLRPVGKRDFQMAAKAQKPSVAPCEVTRYEVYNAKHGAKYVGDGSSDDEW
ncbi:unnamed protein product [Ostreobium quekettii]|uniref:AAA+ ATPase domain-containing protein n=2 Tax=Ostreobium quekettii TaxID=121088 RepID=A0A8S1IJQ2_9CHLO|nr:unnamed protein product [Ostreobium quekettii]|eukprot:evm.model.scf_1897.1 EVM.evm.TU.scf_1897.1   scf_1897:2379-8037(-)